MSAVSMSPRLLLPLAMIVAPATAGLAAQNASDADLMGTVTDEAAPMTAGPDVDGIISARRGLGGGRLDRRLGGGRDAGRQRGQQLLAAR